MFNPNNANVAYVNTAWKRLRMPFMADQTEAIVETCKAQEMSPIEIMSYILQIAIDEREVKRIRLATNQAGFPRLCKLEEFECDEVTGLNQGQLRDLARLDWLAKAENLLFMGPPGVGKTHLAIGLGRKAIEAGKRVRFTTALGLMADLERAYSTNTIEEAYRKYNQYHVLIIDEIGYSPMHRESASLFFELINRRYERASTIITTNLDPSEWAGYFGDVTMTAAILDRLVHHCGAYSLEGESYRLKQRGTIGFVKPA